MKRHMPTILLVDISLASQGATFLANSHEPTSRPAATSFGKALVYEFENASSNISWADVENQAKKLEADLKPMFRAMPKNNVSKLGPAAARYMLNRHFMRRGWSINGIAPNGEAWSTQWHAKILQDRAPARIQEILRAQLEGPGLDVRNIALLAAVIDALIADSEAEQLKAAYELKGVPLSGKLRPDMTSDAYELFLAAHVLGENLVGKSRKEAKKVQEMAEMQFVQWFDARNHIHYARDLIGDNLDRVSFKQGVKLVVEVSRDFNRWLEPECKALVDGLTSIEGAMGRVRLGAFYGAALSANTWRYSESVNYLRSIGALDDSDPKNLKVIIANYASGPGNCLASSTNYAVCCQDPCQGILGRLEEKLSMPSAKPTQLAGAVAQLSNAGENVSNAMPGFMFRRLQDIAELHAGRVPLHSRLFAEWLHVAFPNKCPYPHPSGTIHIRDPLVYTKETGNDWDATEEEMHQHAEAERAACQTRKASGVSKREVAWSTEEETLADLHVSEELPAPTSHLGSKITSKPTWRERASLAGFVTAASSMAVGLLWSISEPLACTSCEPARAVCL